MAELAGKTDEQLAKAVGVGNILIALLEKDTDQRAEDAAMILAEQRYELIQEQRRRGNGPPDAVIQMKAVDIMATAKGV